MFSRRALWLLGGAALLLAAVCAAQRPFRVYPSIESYDALPCRPIGSARPGERLLC
jgi:hypothetical protein